MSCCKLDDPKSVLGCGFQVSFGLSLALVGLAHYMSLDAFSGMVSEGMGPLSGLASLWAYILPALQIVGGVLLVAKQQKLIAVWCVTVALGSIAVGLLLKPVVGGADLGAVMPMAQNALLWLVFFAVGMKLSCCGGECKK